MPPKRRRGGRRRPIATRQVATLKAEMRTAEVGRFSNKSSAITLPPYISNARVFRTVRLQNNAGSPGYVATISNIFSSIAPAFEHIQLVSATVFGPFVESSGRLGSTPFVPGDIISSEIIVNAGINFYYNALGNAGAIAGPKKAVMPSASRRGLCRWHWSARDSAFVFSAYGDGLASCWSTIRPILHPLMPKPSVLIPISMSQSLAGGGEKPSP